MFKENIIVRIKVKILNCRVALCFFVRKNFFYSYYSNKDFFWM